MIDDEIVHLVWKLMVVKWRFEDNPYSLSLDQMGLLKDYETIFTAVGKTHSANSRFSKCVTN